MAKLRNIAVTQDASGNVWYMEWPDNWPKPDNVHQTQVEYVRDANGVDTRIIRNMLINFYELTDAMATNARVVEAYEINGGFGQPRYSQRVPDPSVDVAVNRIETALAEAEPALMVERTVVVRFHYRSNEVSGYGSERAAPAQKEYHYIWDGPKIKPGSIVVVKVPSSGFVAATVVKELDYLSEQSTKYIVQVVDTGKYEQRAEKAKLREEILKQLREAAKKSDEIVKFQLLAAQDPKIASLLDQLQRV